MQTCNDFDLQQPPTCDSCVFRHAPSTPCPLSHCVKCDPATCCQLACPPKTGCADCGLAGVPCAHQGVMNLCPCHGLPLENSMSYLGLTLSEQEQRQAEFCPVNSDLQDRVERRREERLAAKRKREHVQARRLKQQRRSAAKRSDQ